MPLKKAGVPGQDYGDKIVLLLHGYDKGADPSPRRQQREIVEAANASARSTRAGLPLELYEI